MLISQILFFFLLSFFLSFLLLTSYFLLSVSSRVSRRSHRDDRHGKLLIPTTRQHVIQEESYSLPGCHSLTSRRSLRGDSLRLYRTTQIRPVCHSDAPTLTLLTLNVPTYYFPLPTSHFLLLTSTFDYIKQKAGGKTTGLF